MLIAQAILEGLTLITGDKQMEAYDLSLMKP
jgi:hypothetical protein